MKGSIKNKKKIHEKIRFLGINANAFSSLELILVIALVTIIGFSSIPFLSRFFTQSATSDTYNRLLAEFRTAQTNAMLGKQNGPWGVYYGTVGGTKEVILYQGTSYATHTNTAFDQVYAVNPNVTVTGFSDINFSQVSGIPSAATTVTVSGTSNTTKTIQIDAHGIVNYAVAGPTNTPAPTPLATPTPTTAPTAVPTPTAPTGLVATGGDAQITLNWNAIGGDYYYIYEKNVTLGETTFTKLAYPVTTNTFTYAPVANGQLYTFEVSAINTAGVEGPLSSPASATALAPTPTPTNTPTPSPTPTLYTLSGTVYVDTNGDGVQDNGEIGHNGATVKLNTGASTTTNSSGAYSFGNLSSGTYTVTLTIPGGYHGTAPVSGAATVPVNSNMTQNFGIAVNPTATPTPRPTATPTPTPWCPTVTNLHVTSVGTTTVGIAWNASPHATNYQVRVTYQTQVINTYYTSGALSSTVTGLTNNQTYGLHVVAIDDTYWAPEASISQKTN